MPDYQLVLFAAWESKQYDYNLFAKEISILDPDIIIGMLHAKDMQDWYSCIGTVSCVREFNDVNLDKLTTEYGEYYLIDTYHFSHALYEEGRSIVDKCKNHFYIPIMEAFRYLK